MSLSTRAPSLIICQIFALSGLWRHLPHVKIGFSVKFCVQEWIRSCKWLPVLELLVQLVACAWVDCLCNWLPVLGSWIACIAGAACITGCLCLRYVYNWLPVLALRV